ncbi:unnamed protein product, partial [Prorocentrum cordatum]
RPRGSQPKGAGVRPGDRHAHAVAGPRAARMGGCGRLSRHRRRRRHWEAAQKRRPRQGPLARRGGDAEADENAAFFVDVVGESLQLPPSSAERGPLGRKKRNQGTRCAGEAQSAPEETDGARVDAEPAPSAGSRGHPGSCKAACRFHASRGGCRDGVRCRFCHLCVAPPRAAADASGTEGAAAGAAAAYDQDAGQLPHLAQYLSTQFTKARTGALLAAESSRFFSGDRGSKTATHTDDGNLTKLGAKQVCLICLQAHKSWACPQRRCFICFALGHDVKHCPKFKTKCEICGRKGHEAADCLWQVQVDAARWENWRGVRCMRCQALGHVMCGRSLDAQGAGAVEEAPRLGAADPLPAAEESPSGGAAGCGASGRGATGRGSATVCIDAGPCAGRSKGQRKRRAQAERAPDSRRAGGASDGEARKAGLRAELLAQLARQSGRNGAAGVAASDRDGFPLRRSLQAKAAERKAQALAAASVMR